MHSANARQLNLEPSQKEGDTDVGIEGELVRSS